MRVSRGDVQVRNAEALIPDPLQPKQETHRVRLADFSLRSTPTLQAVQAWDFNVTYKMPALMAPFFDGAETLTYLRFQAATKIDLLAPHPGYRLEGVLTLLNQERGRGTIDYYPGDYASISVSGLSIPTALPNVCFNIRGALLELDFADRRLRLMGSAEFDTVESFFCHQGDLPKEMSFITRALVTYSVDTAREALGLPATIEAYGHLVVDLDDGILCADLAASGRSLFHAAYLGNQNTFQMWAPRSFRTTDVSGDRIWGSTWGVVKDFFTAESGFPEVNYAKCWDGDPGPKTDLNVRLIPAPSIELQSSVGSYSGT